MENAKLICIIVLSLSAAVFDVWRGKIPNLIIVTGLSIGFIFQIINKELLGIIFFLGGAGLPIILLGGLFYFRMLGAGDIKLFCALGGFLGIKKGFYCILTSFFVGGVLSLCLLMKRRNLRQRLGYFHSYISNYLQSKVWQPYRKNEDTSSHIHFSIPILISIVFHIGGLY